MKKFLLPILKDLKMVILCGSFGDLLFIEENYIFISAKCEVMPCYHYNPDKFSIMFGDNKELDNIYKRSLDNTNVYTSNIKKVLKSQLFAYIMKNNSEIPYCQRECSIRISDKIFKELHNK